MIVRTSLTYSTAPSWYTATNMSFVGSKYDMWKINGNCTHYAYARTCELANKKINTELFPKGFIPDAGRWLEVSGWKYGRDPKPGAIGVCENHVFIVEEVLEDGEYTISESSYREFIFNYRKRATKVGDQYSPASGRLKAFIYNPYVENETSDTIKSDITSEQAIDKMAKDVISGKYGNGRENRRNNLYRAVQARVNELLK